MFEFTNNMNIWTVFLTGLFVGGLSCLAVQGGLLATTIAQKTQDTLQQKTTAGHAAPIAWFLLSKLLAYTFLGMLLGWLGSLFQVSITMTIIMQILVALFMLGTALQMLHVHPIFRYFVIQPPRFITRYIRKESKSQAIFAPALLGALTIFIPCGTTQAMMALAISSGNPLSGAAILFAFVLGTSPVFFLLGYFATKLGDLFKERFTKIAAGVLILLAVFTFDNSIALTGNTFTLGNTIRNTFCLFVFCDTSDVAVVQSATITITDDGYSPKNLSVKAGSTVTLHLVNEGAGGCAQAFTLPEYDIQKIVPQGNSDTITFTAPDKPGSEIAFMCSMGMYRGTIKVI
ncbi:MAG: sulfite exporter TauE/SafE family protein [Patescibacteria group bacterium]